MSSASRQNDKHGLDRPCPICGDAASKTAHPFCSERCKDVDLNRWLSGGYAIPVTEDDDEDGADPALDRLH